MVNRNSAMGCCCRQSQSSYGGSISSDRNMACLARCSIVVGSVGCDRRHGLLYREAKHPAWCCPPPSGGMYVARMVRDPNYGVGVPVRPRGDPWVDRILALALTKT